MKALKADWADVLKDFAGNDAALAHGFSMLDEEIPISTVFRDWCRQYRTETVYELPQADPQSQAKLDSVRNRLGRITSGKPNSDWALRTLDRSLRESQINGRAIDCCFEALKAHGRLAEAPMIVREKHKAVYERFAT